MPGLQGDTHPVTGVFVPSLGTLIAGDVVFSGTHVWTADSTPESRARWQAQLTELEALPGLERVVPGHQAAGADQTTAALGYTREYVAAFDEVATGAESSAPIIEAMQSRYPDAIGGFFLNYGAQVVTGEAER